ncbi:conserved hypothetical protein [Ureaplasma urealyticum serovar 10 str. ATCC 33699]|uniref:DUF1410 domain-containing protein n=1 Tax=Ureaplasma urealyticum serovar 10 (strain ATCC 33699 / Western) TaxID=565575 RepID=B5ZBZ1_UREU1|nr:DUF1410 domain-containing protein [Ureaplasma urealyticum]ACI60081.1 conserved hypothetical protein [Ureaplasma urealyticum serovar 10 str. ATCC 33699]
MKKNTRKKFLQLFSLIALIPLSSFIVMCSKAKTQEIKEQSKIKARSIRFMDKDLTSINIQFYFDKIDIDDILVKKFNIELEDDKKNKINIDVNPIYNKKLQLLSFKLENLKPNTTYKITKFSITNQIADLTKVDNLSFNTSPENNLPNLPNLPNDPNIKIEDIKTNEANNNSIKITLNINIENNNNLENKYVRLVYKDNENKLKLSNILKINDLKKQNFILEDLTSNRKYSFEELIIGESNDLNLNNAQTKISTNQKQKFSFVTLPNPVKITAIEIDSKFDNNPSSLITLKFKDNENNLKENDILKIKYKKAGPNQVVFEKSVRLTNNLEVLFEIENIKKNEQYEIISIESNSKHGYNVNPSVFNFSSNSLRIFSIKD